MRLTVVTTVVLVVWSAGLARAAGNASPTGPQVPLVAVLDFEVRNGSAQNGDVARAAMSACLNKCGRFQTCERADLKKILGQQRLAMTGLVDSPTNAAKVGKLLGARLLICGSVQSISSGGIIPEGIPIDLPGGLKSTKVKVVLHCKAIDAQDGTVWKESTVEGSASAIGSEDPNSLLPRAMEDAAKEFVDTCVLPLEGEVIGVIPEEGSFIVDLGALWGIKENTEFRVEKLEKRERFSSTGKSLGRRKILVCLAHSVKNGVDRQMTTLVPGVWEGRNWKEHKDWISKVEVGFRVIVQPREH